MQDAARCDAPSGEGMGRRRVTTYPLGRPVRRGTAMLATRVAAIHVPVLESASLEATRLHEQAVPARVTWFFV